ncbi:MAG: nucleotidyltransferase family protein, partial [Actinomycetota bacterium]|nr:nucleotidyltransferase family protein [Actinomycetota bacterium]
MAEPAADDRLAVRVAAIGLPGRRSHEPVSVPPHIWPDVLSRLSSQRLTGIALAGVESGEFLLSDEQVEDLLERHRQSMSLALELERALVMVGTALVQNGVEFVVLKGPA